MNLRYFNQQYLDDMDLRVKALVWAEMVSAGIVPMEASTVALNKKIDPQMADLPEDEQRRLKRKFRKLWRKKRGRFLRAGEPSAGQMRRRKNEVIRTFCVQAMDEIKKRDPGAFDIPW